MNTKSISLQLLCAALCATSIAPTINANAAVAKKNKSIDAKNIALKVGLTALGVTSVVLALKKAPTVKTDIFKNNIINTSSAVYNWISGHKALTTLFSLALLYPHINNYLVEAGKEELKNEKTGALPATPVTMKEKILYQIKKMIGYKIQTKNGEAKIKVLDWNNNMDLVLKGELEIQKTELKSVKLGRLFEIIETTIEKNQALLVAAFIATIIKNSDDIAKVFPSVVKPV
jgi:hypothetical protein